MMLVRCYLAPSSIEGLGVFCHDNIKAGQNVWAHEDTLDQRIPADKVATLPAHVREFVDRYAYPDWNNPGYVILETDEGRFMNHADEPNLDFSDGVHGFAVRDIPAGTELTCHYSTFTEGPIVMQPPRHRVSVHA